MQQRDFEEEEEFTTMTAIVASCGTESDFKKKIKHNAGNAIDFSGHQISGRTSWGNKFASNDSAANDLGLMPTSITAAGSSTNRSLASLKLKGVGVRVVSR